MIVEQGVRMDIHPMQMRTLLQRNHEPPEILLGTKKGAPPDPAIHRVVQRTLILHS
jgi:hypothetical protein